MMVTPWNLPMLFAPSAARSTNASTAGETPSSSSPTPSSPRTAPPLDLLWRSYVRRFDLEHTLRFLKQSMGWTTPRVRHPEQADRWSWLVVAAYTQLRLARARVADLRLP
jgi:hypothetical protein